MDHCICCSLCRNVGLLITHLTDSRLMKQNQGQATGYQWCSTRVLRTRGKAAMLSPWKQQAHSVICSPYRTWWESGPLAIMPCLNCGRQSMTLDYLAWPINLLSVRHDTKILWCVSEYFISIVGFPLSAGYLLHQLVCFVYKPIHPLPAALLLSVLSS